MPWIKIPKPSKVYTLKITLDESNPPVWRRVQVTDVMTLGGLHATLQVAMGWEDCHMHEFKIKGTRYRAGSPFVQVYDDEEGLDEGKSFLGDVLRRKGQRFSYWYDFGDDWMHTIKVEAISEPESGKHYPVCLDGAQACPPEDCGGLYGYATGSAKTPRLCVPAVAGQAMPFEPLMSDIGLCQTSSAPSAARTIAIACSICMFAEAGRHF